MTQSFDKNNYTLPNEKIRLDELAREEKLINNKIRLLEEMESNLSKTKSERQGLLITPNRPFAAIRIEILSKRIEELIRQIVILKDEINEDKLFYNEFRNMLLGEKYDLSIEKINNQINEELRKEKEEFDKSVIETYQNQQIKESNEISQQSPLLTVLPMTESSTKQKTTGISKIPQNNTDISIMPSPNTQNSPKISSEDYIKLIAVEKTNDADNERIQKGDEYIDIVKEEKQAISKTRLSEAFVAICELGTISTIVETHMNSVTGEVPSVFSADFYKPMLDVMDELSQNPSFESAKDIISQNMTLVGSMALGVAMIALTCRNYKQFKKTNENKEDFKKKLKRLLPVDQEIIDKKIKTESLATKVK